MILDGARKMTVSVIRNAAKAMTDNHESTQFDIDDTMLTGGT